MQAERVSLPLAWPHQWARLVEDPAYREVDLSSLRYVGETSPLRKHPTVQRGLAGTSFGVRQYRNTDAQHRASQRHASGHCSGQSRLAVAGQHHPDRRSGDRPACSTRG